MRHVVTFFGRRLNSAMVRAEPSLLDRLLGRSPVVHYVCAVPAIGGGRLWIHDTIGVRVRVRARLAADIERARAAVRQ